MKRRTKAREIALQYLYQMDLTHSDLKAKGEFSLDELLFRPGSGKKTVAPKNETSVKEYALRLVREIASHAPEIDELIETSSDNWRMNRMAVVDRNILRIGTCELMYFEDIPAKVAMNEAIELAKKFGDAESSKFVNGILDKIAKKKGIPAEG